jgi:hypothetical protein
MGLCTSLLIDGISGSGLAAGSSPGSSGSLGLRDARPVPDL